MKSSSRRRTTRPAPPDSAEAVGLRYVTDDGPGIRRIRTKSGFLYRDHRDKGVRDRATLSRIGALVIPPAWEEVWICSDPRGHLQATGRDARGRKQYRYHAMWRQTRDESKYSRIVPFGRALPDIRKRVTIDLRRPELDRRKVLALIVRLLETTMIRVGNDEYARTNQSFGLTTLQDGHAKSGKGEMRFVFRGKSGVRHEVAIDDPKLMKLIRACQELPGQELFQFLGEDDVVHDVTSDDVNDYLKDISGHDFTAKDFRTWAGTVLAAVALREFEVFDSQAQAKKNIVRAIESVAKKLGNTPSVCRKCYVHPQVLGSYLDGTMVEILRKHAARAMSQLGSLKPEEAAVLALIQRGLANAGEMAEAKKPGSRKRRAESATSPHPHATNAT